MQLSVNESRMLHIIRPFCTEWAMYSDTGGGNYSKFLIPAISLKGDAGMGNDVYLQIWAVLTSEYRMFLTQTHVGLLASCYCCTIVVFKKSEFLVINSYIIFCYWYTVNRLWSDR